MDLFCTLLIQLAVNSRLRDHPSDGFHSASFSPSNFPTHEIQDPFGTPQLKQSSGKKEHKLKLSGRDVCTLLIRVRRCSSPVSRKSAWKKGFGFEKVKLERNADKFEGEFRKAFQPEFGAYQGLERVSKSPSNPQNYRNKRKILEKGTCIFCANPGMHQTLIQKRSENLEREFVGGALKPWKISGKSLPSKFVEKFASNFPKIRQAKIRNSPQIRSAEPRDQELGDAPEQFKSR